MPKEYIQNSSVYDYLSGKKKIPEDYGKLDISGESSGSNIRYYSWDLTFSSDLNARRPDNAGIDEVQIIFNLNEPIEWDVLSDAAGSDPVHVTMNAGDVCIYRNNDAQTGMKYESQVNFRFKSLQMSTGRFEELLYSNFDIKDADYLKCEIFSGVRVAAITPLMYRILSEIDGADRYKEYKAAFLESKLTELTILVMFETLNNHKKGESPRRQVSAEDKDLVMQLKIRIDNDPADKYNAEELARGLSMSVSKLNRIFRQLFATSLHAYVTDIRLEYAKKLLSESDQTVSEAAYKSGYNNLSHFAKAFTAKYGVNPRDYKRLK
ncbi:MAG: AraC family transcriptional regulator [Lachnospiraceae bacterium]|nr:AraC family transcriptional regulator [Lachnospiraceae bacterium]